MACGRKCFRCRYDISSRPVDREFFLNPMALAVMSVVNKREFLLRVILCSLFKVCLFIRHLRSLLLWE